MLSSEHIQRILARIETIPAYHTLGVRPLSWEEGRCIAIVPKNSDYDGIFQSYHGGMLMTAADTIACFALMTQIDPKETLATTDMNIRFLAPCKTDARVDARLIKLGKTLNPVQVDLFDLNDRLVAVAQVTYMRIAPKR
jgi:uncharacterized protein (TIGR00369 family)